MTARTDADATVVSLLEKKKLFMLARKEAKHWESPHWPPARLSETVIKSVTKTQGGGLSGQVTYWFSDVYREKSMTRGGGPRTKNEAASV